MKKQIDTFEKLVRGKIAAEKTELLKRYRTKHEFQDEEEKELLEEYAAWQQIQKNEEAKKAIEDEREELKEKSKDLEKKNMKLLGESHLFLFSNSQIEKSVFTEKVKKK